MIELYQPILIYPGLEYKAYGFIDASNPTIGVVTYINKEHGYFLVKCSFGDVTLNICYRLCDPRERYKADIYDVCNYIRTMLKPFTKAARG